MSAGGAGKPIDPAEWAKLVGPLPRPSRLATRQRVAREARADGKSAALWLSAPRTPGATPSEFGPYATIEAARDAAEELFGGRTDLSYQSVQIIHPDGSRVEYAGPCR